MKSIIDIFPGSLVVFEPCYARLLYKTKDGGATDFVFRPHTQYLVLVVATSDIIHHVSSKLPGQPCKGRAHYVESVGMYGWVPIWDDEVIDVI